MALLKKLNLKTKPLLKTAGLVILGLIIVYIVLTLLGSLFAQMPKFQSKSLGGGVANYAPSYQGTGGVSEAMPLNMSSGLDIGKSMGLSERNVASSEDVAYYNNGTPSAGSAAEKYEATQYNVSYKTKQLKNTCDAIGALKAREDVVFENASEYSKSCSFTFKVQREKAGEILDILVGLKPRELAQSAYTIEGQVQDYTGEIDILQNKLAAIDDTLNKATAAYDEVTTLATKEKDVTSLAKIINDKINIIQQLTQQRININSQLEQYQRTKVVQLDRVKYTYFYVNVSDGSFVDLQAIKDSWNTAVKYSVANINQLIQNISVNLVVFLFTIVQYAIYGLILLLVAKYGWKLVKHIWQN